MSKQIMYRIRRIKPDADGKHKIETMPAEVFDRFFSDKGEWEVLQPEHQRTCVPQKAERKPEVIDPQALKKQTIEEWEAKYQDEKGDLPKDYSKLRSLDKKILWLKNSFEEE